MPTTIVRRAHAAMGTRFEAVLVRDDAEHLDAVCTLVLEEIDRVERLLSRFDPASEVARVNRQAGASPVRISPELADVLQQCQDWNQRTEGAFDVVTAADGRRIGWSEIRLDRQHRTVAIQTPKTHFDFGGYGKGYALDCAREVLVRYGVTNAFLHGGTSSALALGTDHNGERWRVDCGLGSARQTIELADQALSTSATVDELSTRCETIAPRSGERLSGQMFCTVVAASAAIAEIASTGFLVLGPAALTLLDRWHKQGEKSIEGVFWSSGAPGREQFAQWSPIANGRNEPDVISD